MIVATRLVLCLSLFLSAPLLANKKGISLDDAPKGRILQGESAPQKAKQRLLSLRTGRKALLLGMCCVTWMCLILLPIVSAEREARCPSSLSNPCVEKELGRSPPWSALHKQLSDRRKICQMLRSVCES